MDIATALQTGTGLLIGGARNADDAEFGWFSRLVRYYVKRWRRQHPAGAASASLDNPDARARAAISHASLLSAVSGTASGAVSTGIELAASSWGVLSVPLGLLAVGAEAMFRVKLHVELTCALADMFAVEFDVDDPSDLWRLYALTFHTRAQDPQSSHPDRSLLRDLTSTDEDVFAKEVGLRLVRETLLRNIVPGVAIATSAYTNYMLTQRLGDTVRRYMRYQRALQDTFAQDTADMPAERQLLIEGIWFIFSADGKLSPEEAVLLASLLNDLSTHEREAMLMRFTLDEQDWLDRIKRLVAERAREPFLRSLEVAAAVDKEVSLPEQKILGRAARALGKSFDVARVESMIRAFENDGVLSMPTPREDSSPASPA